jgi:hypothetical protein
MQLSIQHDMTSESSVKRSHTRVHSQNVQCTGVQKMFDSMQHLFTAISVTATRDSPSYVHRNSFVGSSAFAAHQDAGVAGRFH